MTDDELARKDWLTKHDETLCFRGCGRPAASDGMCWGPCSGLDECAEPRCGHSRWRHNTDNPATTFRCSGCWHKPSHQYVCRKFVEPDSASSP